MRFSYLQILSKALNDSRSAKLDISVKDAVDKILSEGNQFSSDRYCAINLG